MQISHFTTNKTTFLYSIFLYLIETYGSYEEELLEKHRTLLNSIVNQQTILYDEATPSDLYVCAFLYIEFIYDIIQRFTIPIIPISITRQKNLYLKKRFGICTSELRKNNFELAQLCFNPETEPLHDLNSALSLKIRSYICQIIMATIDRRNTADVSVPNYIVELIEASSIYAYSFDNYNNENVFVNWSKKQYLDILCKSKGFQLLLLENINSNGLNYFEGIMNLDQIFMDFLKLFDRYHNYLSSINRLN